MAPQSTRTPTHGPLSTSPPGPPAAERTDNFTPVKPYWSAVRSSDYGFTRLRVENDTHLYWGQVSDDQGESLVDQVWLIKDRHESFQDDTNAR